ncbi:hypothetical protein FRB95_000730 [Tulasnella sp. JGI-2019a]|nr:hypothetical protein FRB95_000730 [Tulasnella sp. JGI-2019a]
MGPVTERHRHDESLCAWLKTVVNSSTTQNMSEVYSLGHWGECALPSIRREIQYCHRHVPSPYGGDVMYRTALGCERLLADPECAHLRKPEEIHPVTICSLQQQ